MVLPARSKPLWRFALRVSTTTARVILSLPNFRACTKARAVGEARSRAVFAQDDTRGDLSSFSCYNIVGANCVRPYETHLSTRALRLNRQMRKRSFFARILVFVVDRPFCEAKLTPVPTRSEKICIFICRFFLWDFGVRGGPSVLRSKTHAGPYKIGENLRQQTLIANTPAIKVLLVLFFQEKYNPKPPPNYL